MADQTRRESVDFSSAESKNNDNPDRKKDNDRTPWNNIAFSDVEVGEQIGGGGFAVVYKGRYRGRSVALKSMFDPRVDEQLREDFMAELQILSELDHPNIVRLYGACVVPPDLCMVMELCSTSVFHLLHNSARKFSEKEILSIALDTAEALSYLHAQSPPIIHRDVKTQNLLVARDGQVRLCDFGLVGARTAQAGTPAYMAPELLRGSPFSRKVDTYSFGVLLWELVMRKVPFAGWETIDVRDFVLRGDRLDLPLSGCPKAFMQLIDRCWSHDQDTRPEFAKVAKALARMHSSIKEVSHTDRAVSDLGDSFDRLSSNLASKK